MKKILFACLAALLSVACQTEGNLRLTYDGLLNDTVLVEYAPLRAVVGGRRVAPDVTIERDTVCLDGGRLVMQLATDEPQLVRVRPFHYRIAATNGRVFYGDGGTVNVVLQNDERVQMTLKMQRSGYLKARVKGSELNADIQFIGNQIRAARHDYEALAALIGKEGRENPALRDSLRGQLNQKQTALRQLYVDYIEANPAKEASAYLLYEMGGHRGSQLYDKLDKQVFVGTFRPVADLVEYYREVTRVRNAARQEISEGKPVPDFTLRDRDGRQVTLSSLRGKWVVVEFWGSWDQRSLRGMEAMKRAYAKHKKRLEIVGVACNDLPDRWRAALDKYELPWINVIDPSDAAPAESVALRFGVGTYPTKYIITPDGKVHKIAQGEHTKFYEELDRVIR